MPSRALALLAAALAASCALLPPETEDDGRTQSWAIDATLAAKPSQASYRAGEPVSVRVTLTNEGDTPLSCLMPCGELAAVGTLTDPAGAQHEIHALPSAGPANETAYWKPLSRLETAEQEIPVNGRFFLSEPGRYSLRVVARGRQGWIDRLHPRVGDLETTVKFEVVASTGL